MFPLKKSGFPSPNEYNKFYFVHFSGFHNIHLLGSGTEKGTIGVSSFKCLFFISLCLPKQNWTKAGDVFLDTIFF